MFLSLNFSSQLLFSFLMRRRFLYWKKKMCSNCEHIPTHQNILRLNSRMLFLQFHIDFQMSVILPNCSYVYLRSFTFVCTEKMWSFFEHQNREMDGREIMNSNHSSEYHAHCFPFDSASLFHYVYLYLIFSFSCSFLGWKLLLS